GPGRVELTHVGRVVLGEGLPGPVLPSAPSGAAGLGRGGRRDVGARRGITAAGEGLADAGVAGGGRCLRATGARGAGLLLAVEVVVRVVVRIGEGPGF